MSGNAETMRQIRIMWAGIARSSDGAAVCMSLSDKGLYTRASAAVTRVNSPSLSSDDMSENPTDLGRAADLGMTSDSEEG